MCTGSVGLRGEPFLLIVFRRLNSPCELSLSVSSIDTSRERSSAANCSSAAVNAHLGHFSKMNINLAQANK
jgi:hypothetical protein